MMMATLKKPSVTVTMSFVWLASCAGIVDAGMFLGKSPQHLKHNVDLEHKLLAELETALGDGHRTFTEKRLATIKKVADPIFAALPKNEHGKLGSEATSYALYRIFKVRHGWFVTGLEPHRGVAAWSDISPTSIIDEHAPEFITGLFNTRLGESGFGVQELAVLAATLEHFIHQESLERANAAYRSLNFTAEDTLGAEDVEEVMDTYMAMYAVGAVIPNYTTMPSEHVRNFRRNAPHFFPTFPETQQYIREVRKEVAAKRDHFYYADVASLVEEVGDRYGNWQARQCLSLKDMLLEMEDKSPGGAGRVRLADFYDASLNGGKWQFVESSGYLRELGALDESDPDNVRVLIPNYINGPSNCLTTSRYYSLCCTNECDELLGDLELKIAAPYASPEKILDLAAALPSPTVPGGRIIAPWLAQRLYEVAKHNGGQIPLHGRLFAQWMHYAYPSECPFPHIAGVVNPRGTSIYTNQTGESAKASKAQMEHFISKPQQQKDLELGGDEVPRSVDAMWTMEEELLVAHSAVIVESSTTSALAQWIRGSMGVGVVMSMCIVLKFHFNSALTGVSQKNDKYCV